MLVPDSMITLVLLVAAGLMAAFFASMYRLKRQTYLLLWTIAWGAVALRALSAVAAGRFLSPRWQQSLETCLLGFAAILFFTSAQAYSQKRIWRRGAGVAAGIIAVWEVAYGAALLPVSAAAFVALILVSVGIVFWIEGKRQDTRADRLLGLVFVVWGALNLGFFLQGLLAYPWFSTLEMRLLNLLPHIFAGLLMVTALYEEEKRRIERNMLALSNLNLATSTFVGGEIQKMLAQALDRVLSVVRIPAGGLCLHYGNLDGPKSLVATGLGDAFCTAMQQERLDGYLVQLIARLGGLVVLRDLARDAAWVALERDPSFHRTRELLVRQGMRTVIGISLQAKDRVFGVLILATPDNRFLTPAELRLLLALGHQIGMAVENSYLTQQTARRSEELHILNEIGRALSSTLDPDVLFEKIYKEMRRLLDVSSFYIAFIDERRKEIRFELEILEGHRRPKRTRPAGNHLTEYMIRSRQPLLIRENFVQATDKLKVQALQRTGCFCGVPLVLYDRAIGVMAVHSLQERVFDEGHLELMRVLASEAGIAIENARLFAGEQTKSRHLSLLNNISRHAITTLNPDDMLAKIVQELETGIRFEHSGIAVMDYAARGLVVQAEAGRRKGAVGRRIGLDQGLIGQVARSGKTVVLREISLDSAQPLLEGTRSAIALPMMFADQLLGVLYSESERPDDFNEEDTLLLTTLADLFAGALHSAQSYQRAQEQAITDGLTGVKTHRFLMEALSTEWKRATRAGRPFSFMLLDLDRFKFVNDFYGHPEGNVVLQRIAGILEENCRRSDVVARYGGDEFVVLMPETNAEQAGQLAGKIRAFISEDPVLREKNMTASIGIATFPVHGATPQELIQVADASMYLSKHRGGNTVSTAEHCDPGETRRWKRDVLEAYLGVTLKRQFVTGASAFEEIFQRLEHFTRSLDEQTEAEADESLPTAVIETLTALAIAIDSKSHYTQGHSQKVSGYAVLTARALRLPETEVEELRLAGLLHDVGKVGIAEPILIKAGPLDPTEWEMMKTHAELGAKLLAPLRGVSRIQAIIRHHHEFFDGSGYPQGIAGSEIPLGARIVGIADAFDTITSDRVYKKGRSFEDACTELERCSGTQFDPDLIRVFIAAVQARTAVADSPHPAETGLEAGQLR